MQETPQELDTERFFIARQPIFDIRQRPCAFELLFRDSGTAKTAVISDPDMATMQMITSGFILGRGDENKPVFINFTGKMLTEGFTEALPAGKCVIEFLEDFEPNESNAAIVSDLRKAGYKFAIDNFTGTQNQLQWLPNVDFVKVDVLEFKEDPEKLSKLANQLAGYQGLPIAEKVESIEEFKSLRKLGFQLFQGFFFCKPEILEGRRISSGETTKLQLLQEVGKKDFDVNRLSDLLRTDTSLSYRLFRYINSAGMGLSVPIKTLNHAISLLGQKKLVKWLRVLLLSDLSRSPKTEEVVFTSVQRGRFLELIAEGGKTDIEQETMFLLGMFSLLDAMLGKPMDKIVEKMPLDAEIKAALVGKKNRFWLWLQILQAYEKQQWQALQSIGKKLGFEVKDLDHCYTKALEWTNQMIGTKEQ